jgi:hypothetical protein
MLEASMTDFQTLVKDVLKKDGRPVVTPVHLKNLSDQDPGPALRLPERRSY